MRTTFAILAGVALAGAGCLFLPDIGRYGYVACSESSQCGPGRTCQAGYCAPPPWWNEKYTARHQVLVDNGGSTTVNAGVVLEFLVGAGGALTIDQTGFAPALVLDDRANGEQRPATALRDPRGDRYAFVFKLPADVAPKTAFGNLWLYTMAAEDVAPSYSLPGDVYTFFDPFDGIALAAADYRVQNTVDVSSGQAVLRTGAWLVTVAAYRASEVAVDLQLLGASCGDFGFGFGAGHATETWEAPYAMFVADASGTVHHEVWPFSQVSVEELGSPFPSDGLDHRMAVAVAGPRVIFSVDGIVTAEGEPSRALDGEMHVHLFSRDCQVRVTALQIAPRPAEMPTVRVEEAVAWFR
ncbi:MAG: hypothetical protein JXR83_04755 [Deltaproteobacteria bacterium]|nr:hypothetical protein [Deltaproteobacteria bacterium]